MCESMRKSWEENTEIMIGNSHIALIHYLLPQNESGLERDPNFCFHVLFFQHLLILEFGKGGL